MPDPPIIWVATMIGADQIHGDRRAAQRFEFEMPLHFLYQSGGSQYQGSGRTVDLARKGICFVSDEPPPLDANVELRIEWPFLLQNVCPLELRVWGRVLRNDVRGIVVRMSRYEFRTCGKRSFDEATVRPEHWSIFA